MILCEEQIKTYERDGALLLRNVFTKDQLNLIEKGINQNLDNPSKYANENDVPQGQGRFFDDYCNWATIEPFQKIIQKSSAPQIAAEVMRSSQSQFFHDHVLVKEPKTGKASPWHQDMPYYFINGNQNVSMWIPIDPVEKESTLRLIAGSHHWKNMVRPVKWSDDADFYDSNEVGKDNYLPVPDPDSTSPDVESYDILEWSMNPGDILLFHFRTVHGARGNTSNIHRRRVLSLRWLGDDARYIQRPGKTSPPYPGHGMKEGEKLRDDWFPIIYKDGDIIVR